MNNKIKALTDKVNGLSLRERLMILVAALVMMFVIWDNFLWQPMNAQQKLLQKQISQAEQKLKLLNIQVGGVTAQAKVDPNSDLKQQLERIKLSLQQVQSQVRDATADLVAPKQMARLLESLLRKQGALRLVALRTLGPVPLIDNKAQSESGAGNPGDSKDSNDNSLNLYRHGFILEFEGDYFTVLKYLRDLEALESSFFWDAVQYEVISYPNARVRMHLHTLSLSEGWIGV